MTESALWCSISDYAEANSTLLNRASDCVVGSVPPMALLILLFYHHVAGSALFFQVPIPLDVHHVDL
jgi:hypothetical protein